MIAHTPQPPYYAVIFSSIKSGNDDGYSQMSNLMFNLASEQQGFLGLESAQNDLGITVSYWEDLESIKQWKQHTEHQYAQKEGKAKWYKDYKVRIAKVERDYSF
ncbi:antibiotic biosynthesis monooxygenase [Flavobacteriaceae bacterium GSB9]|nr:antibiotic biosynthesis monooxygenase [Flavobacteriaceae bacterium GSB9]